MAEAAKKFGITPPISTVPPNEKDNILNQALVDELKANSNYETPEGVQKRYDGERETMLRATTDRHKDRGLEEPAEDDRRVRQADHEEEESTAGSY